MSQLCGGQVPGEEDLLIREMEEEEEVRPTKPAMCVVSRDGLTLFGWNLPWIVIIIALVALGWYLNKQGMFSEKVSSVTRPPPVTQRPVPRIQAGGFRGLVLESPGEIRQMFGH